MSFSISRTNKYLEQGMLNGNKYVAPTTCMYFEEILLTLIKPVYDNSVKFMKIDLQILIILLYVLREKNIGVQESSMHLILIF